MNVNIFLNELKKYGEKNDIPNISKVNATFLKDLIHIKKAKNILEVWTANGFSTINLALATLPFWWKVTTIEFSEKSRNDALENFKKAKVDSHIISYLWNALDIIPTLTEKYDFIFIDGMKKRSLDFYLLCIKKAKKWTIIIIDDVIKFRHKMENLYTYFEENKIPHNIIPIDEDDGILMTIKR